jgi:hypothetical protein
MSRNERSGSDLVVRIAVFVIAISGTGLLVWQLWPAPSSGPSAASGPALTTTVASLPNPEPSEPSRREHDDLPLGTAGGDEYQRFSEEVVLDLGDTLMEEFAESFVNIEIVESPMGVIIYVNGEADRIRARAQELIRDEGALTVRLVKYTNEEIAEFWYKIEDALAAAGLSVSGAVSPGRIDVYVDDPVQARTIVDELNIPDDVGVTFRLGGEVQDLG